MQSNPLAWWLFKCLSMAMVVLLSIVIARDYARSISVGRESEQANLSARARVIAAWLQQDPAALDSLSVAEVDAICTRYAGPARAQVALYAPDGRVLGASHPIAIVGDGIPEDVKEACEGRTGTWSTHVWDSDVEQLFVAVPIHEGGQMRVVLRMAQQVLPMARPVTWTWMDLLAIVLLGSLTGWTIAAYAARRLQVASSDLCESVERFREGNLTTPAPHGEFPEFEALSVELNSLALGLNRQLLDLTHQTRQWRALFTSMREGLVAVDRDLNIITINRAATQLVNPGADAEGLTGRSLYEAIRNADLQDFIANLMHAMEPATEREVQVPLRSGESVILAVSGVRFQYEEDGTPGVLVVMTNITRLRRLENMRKEFVANVSHELKTPITSIKGYVETLSECINDDPENATRFINIILRQADHLNAIIEDLLYLSRLEQGDPSVFKEFSDGNLQLAVRNAYQLCSRAAEDKGITIVCEVEPLVLHANHRLLEHAITNLLDNAIKYGPRGTEVRIASGREDGCVLLHVADNGTGIPPEDQERIFERFYRVEKSRNRSLGGTGLGLAIVKHILRVHHGDVRVQSIVGQGSTFTLSLPVTMRIPDGPVLVPVES